MGAFVKAAEFIRLSTQKRLAIRAIIESGINFHPDTDAMDYVNENGKRTFNDQEAAEFNRKLELLFVGPGDVYDLGTEELLRAVRQ